MASKHAETQVKVTADTKLFNSKINDAKQNFKDFEKVSEQVSTTLGDTFNIPIGKVEQMAGALKNLGNQLSESGNKGVAAFGNLLKSINATSVAVAGLGIGAVVSAFKLLNSEAEAFKNTIQGANIELSAKAYVDTYAQVMRDARQEMGKGTAETIDDLKKGLGTFWEDIKGGFANWIANGVSGEDGIMAFGGYSLYKAFSESNSASGVAKAKATEAEALQEKLYQLQVRSTEEARKRAELEAQIAEYRRTAYDKNEDLTTREEALAKVKELMAAVYGGSGGYSYTYTEVGTGKQLEGTLLGLTNIEKEMSTLMDDLANLASSDVETVNAAAQQYQVMLGTIKQQQDRERELLEIEQQLQNTSKERAKSAAAAAEAAAKEAEAAAAIKTSREQLAALDLGVSDTAAGLGSSNTKVSTGAEILSRTFDATAWEEFAKSVDEGFIKTFGDIKIGVGVELDKKSVQDFSAQLNSLISSSVTEMGTMLGQLFGDLATGGDAWGNFKSAALSAMGDLAIALGKLAIEAGLASEGIKAALHLDNPYIAIAAGVALIALGAAVKTGLSNISNGNYSSSSATASVASSSYSSSSSSQDWAESEVNVKVTGTLQANGSALVAVLNNEEKRKSHTT